jgi:hypothetical protein
MFLFISRQPAPHHSGYFKWESGIMDLIGQRVFSDKMAGLPHATIHEYSIFGVNKHGSKDVYVI